MRITELAASSGLTPKALRLYDDLGLLRPDAVDPATGYRTYAPEQLGRARRVAALRRAGMPLRRIAAVCDEVRAAAAADLEAWWRQVEHDVTERRALVGTLLAQWRTQEDPVDSTTTVTTTTGPVRPRGASGSEEGGRASRQDAAGVDERVAVVADGFGADGASVSRAVVDAVLVGARRPDPAGSIDLLRAAFGSVVPAETGSGTTATALYCDGAP